LYGYQAFFVKPLPKPVNGGSAPNEKETTSGLSGRTGSTLARPLEASAAPIPKALVGDTEEREIRVETADVIAVFTNRGARLKSWRLKHYLDQQKQPQELVAGEI